MPQSRAKRAEPVQLKSNDILAIRRQIQNLEFQVQKLIQRIEGEAVGPKAALAAGVPVSYRLLKEVIEARRVRDRHFDGSLFGEPAWDILLELYASELAQMPLTVTQLCIGAAVPSSTALRWISNLENSELLTRSPDPMDGRRMFVSMTDKARRGFAGYFEEVLSFKSPHNA